MSTSPHFELKKTKDLFVKASEDFKKFNLITNSHDLFNFMCTVNSMFDWAKEEFQDTPTRASGNDDTCTLNIVRRLCNRAKHYKKGNSPPTEVRKGYGCGRYGVGLYGKGEPSYLVEVDGALKPAREICEDALTIWEVFLKGKKVL